MPAAACWAHRDGSQNVGIGLTDWGRLLLALPQCKLGWLTAVMAGGGNRVAHVKPVVAINVVGIISVNRSAASCSC